MRGCQRPSRAVIDKDGVLGFRKAAKKDPLPMTSEQLRHAMGIAEYRLVESLPAELQTSLPSIEQIEQALANEAGEGDA